MIAVPLVCPSRVLPGALEQEYVGFWLCSRDRVSTQGVWKGRERAPRVLGSSAGAGQEAREP